MPTAVDVLHCSECHRERKTKATPKGQLRVPTGWHRRKENTYCEECWAKRYLLRAVSMPVAEPVSCSWEDLRGYLKVLWRQTTQASNWIMSQLYVRDVAMAARREGVEKIPGMERVYLYPELRKLYPDLPPQTVASLEQACQKKYRSIRRALHWTCAESLPTFRYPTPVPIHNQSWSVRIEQDKPIVRVRLAPGDEGAVEVRLKSGSQFHRQYKAIRQLARGEAIGGEAALYQRGNRLMLKLVAWLPRDEPRESLPDVLRVVTQKECLLAAINAKDETLWRYNADHLRRWAAEHRQQLQRWAEDQKYEQRPVPSFAGRRAAAARKYRDRMDSATQEIAAQLAAYASRRRFAAVRYDDNERGYLDGFPWYRLRALIAQQVQARGMTFEASGPAETKEPEPLAEEQDK
jgi:hypothetical protein